MNYKRCPKCNGPVKWAALVQKYRCLAVLGEYYDIDEVSRNKEE